MIVVQLDEYRMNKQYEDYYGGSVCFNTSIKEELNTYNINSTKELVAGYMKLLTNQIQKKEV